MRCTECLWPWPAGGRAQQTRAELQRALCRKAGWASAVLWLAGCAAAPSASPPSTPPDAPTPAAVLSAPTAPAAPVQAAPAATRSLPAPAWPLVAPGAARSWDEFQLQAARRLVAANPGRVFLGQVPDPLLAIPVLEVELTAEGQVRRIKVLRMPTQATDTVQLAKDAVHRAAPYGAMRHLDKPWTFVEVFLFDDERRFKPRTLDH